MTTKIALSWSSGKDSAWALELLRADPSLDVALLLTTVNESNGRIAMHGVRRELLELQAKAAGLPLHVVPLPHPCSNEAYERAMAETCEELKRAGIGTVAFGDIHLADVRAYREARMAEAGMACLFPLWGRPSEALAREMTAGGMRARIVCLDAKHLGPEFLGRDYDQEFLASLPEGVDPCGENGEFHTFCFATPAFAAPVAVDSGERVEREGFLFLDLAPARYSGP